MAEGVILKSEINYESIYIGESLRHVATRLNDNPDAALNH